MIKLSRLGHATFETPDIEKAIEHHTQVIGLSLVARERDRAYLATRLGQLAVEFVKSNEAKCAKLSFEVPASSDFAAIRRELAGHGVSAEEKSDATPGLSQVLSFTDPKGTTIELFRDWSTVGNGQQVVGAGAFKLGHVAFIVPEPKAMAEFYGKVLGFRISDWIGDFFVFMRCNADHHTVNFIRGERVAMHHIAYELKDVAHLQTTCDLLGQRKIPIAWGPVRLGPGHNVATFHRDADDWMTEFYAELDQMKDEELGYFDPRPWHQDRPQRPKVWDSHQVAYIWGPPPTPDFSRRRG
jgi:catechol 2,3-dioxygenase-like lactoylglutathione lyase family enzyme